MTEINSQTQAFSNRASNQSSASPLPVVSASLDSVELTGSSGKLGSPAKPSQTPKNWNVLVYSCSDNNLYSFMQDDLDEAERVGSNDKMNTIVETSHQPVGGTVERLQLMPDKKKGLHSPRLEDLGNRYDMADPKSLADFIEFGETKFPAEHNLLVIADHGGGWQGACESESHDSWLTLPKLAEGLKMAQDATGKKLDVIGFDACLMGSTEVMHELAPYASYIAGSEETEGGAGWQYDDAIGKLKKGVVAEPSHTKSSLSRIIEAASRVTGGASRGAKEQGTTPKEMAEAIVDMAKEHQQDLGAMTAVDTSKIGDLSKAVDEFGRAIVKTKVSSSQLGKIADETQKFYEYYDLSDFAEKVGRKLGKKDPELGKTAAAVQQAVLGSIVSEQHSDKYPNAHGLTIELDRHNGERVPPHL
jgi:hypothetical protein